MHDFQEKSTKSRVFRTKNISSTLLKTCMIFRNRQVSRKRTPAPFKSSCFTETSRIAAGTLLLTEFARWHPGAPASRASGGFTAPDFLSLHSACIQVALLYFCEHFANSPLGRSAPRWRPAEIDLGSYRDRFSGPLDIDLGSYRDRFWAPLGPPSQRVRCARARGSAVWGGGAQCISSQSLVYLPSVRTDPPSGLTLRPD